MAVKNPEHPLDVALLALHLHLAVRPLTGRLSFSSAVVDSDWVLGVQQI